MTRLSVWNLLKESFLFYRRHGWFYTRPLLLPLLKMLLGVYVCLVGGYAYASYVIRTQNEVTPDHLGVFLAISFLGLLMLLWGGWQYAVYMATLNQDMQETIEGGAARPAETYRHFVGTRRWPYKNLLSAYCLAALLLTPLIVLLCIPPAVLGSLVYLMVSPAAGEMLTNVGIAVGSFIGSIPMFVLTFVFQIAALEPLSRNPVVPMLRSHRLFVKAPWRIIGLQSALLILTCIIVPWPLMMTGRLLGLLRPLDQLHGWVLQGHLDMMAADGDEWRAILPQYDQLFGQMQEGVPHLASSLSETALMLVITMLLLPLGSHAFLSLYRELSASPENASPVPAVSSPDC